MKTALFSDVHGNIEALRKVLEDMDARKIKTRYFLGDAISYGPDPETCVQLLKDQNIPCLLGNHELALIKPWARTYFNEPTRLHFEQARKLLSRDSVEFIRTWPRNRIEHDMIMVHGFPPNSVRGYLFELTQSKLKSILMNMNPRIAFVGHTHEIKLITNTGTDILQKELAPGMHALKGRSFIVNIGSVGQPRDGDNRAKYIIYDNESLLIEARFIDYDREKTINDILKLGFPEQYAWRLR
ncbi:MAG: metallophosphoesterase family protein [Desulfonatronovibrionaceae bacterium]